PLDHALLIAIGFGSFVVPVLDDANKVAGYISKTVVLDQLLLNDADEVERLSEITLHEVMDDTVLESEDASLMVGLKSVIEEPFVCVVDDEEYVKGILTRRAILKKLKREYYRR